MNKRKIILIAVIVLIVVIGVVLKIGLSNNNNNNQNESHNIVNNTETNLKDENLFKEPELPTTNISGEKSLDNLEFTNIKILEQSANQNLLQATVINNSSEKVESEKIKIELFTENSERIGAVKGILPEIEANGTGILEVPIGINVMYATDIIVRYAND